MAAKGKKQVRIDETENFWLNLSKPKPRTYPYNGYLVHPEDYGLELADPKPIQQQDVALSHSEEQRLREEAEMERRVEEKISEMKKHVLDHVHFPKYAHERENSFHHYADRSHHYHQMARINRFSSRKALLDYHMDHLLNIYGIYMPKFTGGQDPELELYLQRLRTPSWRLPEATEVSAHQQAAIEASNKLASQVSSAQAASSSAKASSSSLKASSSSLSASSKSLSRYTGYSNQDLYRSYKLHRTQFRRAEYGHRY